MKNENPRYLTKFISNPKRIFVLDGLGAWVSANLFFWVLAPFSRYVGMPSNVLYVLAAIAFGLFIYSAACINLVKTSWKFSVGFLRVLNIAYSLVSIGLIIKYASRLTTLGWTYFILELTIIGVLIWIEYKTYVALD